MTPGCFIDKQCMIKSELLKSPPTTKPPHVNKWYYHWPYHQIVGTIYDPSLFLKPASTQSLTKTPQFILEASLLLIPTSSPFDSSSKYTPNMTTSEGLHCSHSSLSHHHLSSVLLLPFLIPYILLSTQLAAKESKSDVITLQGSLERPFLSALSKISVILIYPFTLLCLSS